MNRNKAKEARKPSEIKMFANTKNLDKLHEKFSSPKRSLVLLLHLHNFNVDALPHMFQIFPQNSLIVEQVLFATELEYRTLHEKNFNK